MTANAAGTMPARYIDSFGRIDTARLRADVSIADVAAEVTDLKRCGDQLRGLCPLHDENSPSFFVNPGRGVYHCFGCATGGDCIDLHSRAHGSTFLETCLALAGAEHAPPRPRDPQVDAAVRELSRQRARAIWHGATAIAGTPAETYLTNRGVGQAVPGSIRFARVPRFWRDDGGPGPLLPAMIAAAQVTDGRVVGVQRTFVTPEGRKDARGSARLGLGRMRGSALRLGPVAEHVMLASAVEDALALRLMFPGASVWATFGDANLAHVRLPPAVRRVTTCGDADPPGRAAVAAAAQALRARGVKVDDLRPRAGKDFNEEWLLLHA